MIKNLKDLEERQIDLAPRWTTMKKVSSTLAVMFMENVLRKGGRIKFIADGVDIELTKENLEGPKDVPPL